MRGKVLWTCLHVQAINNKKWREHERNSGKASDEYRAGISIRWISELCNNFADATLHAELIDRILIGVVAQPIIEEFRLQDWQFGLLSGFGFALMYTIMGIPIARLAERMNRVKIIAASVILWSFMTAMCGIAGSFIALLVFRIGVGIGEAGLTPAANSIISDYFPPRSRARAIAIYTMGITLGGVLDR